MPGLAAGGSSGQRSVRVLGIDWSKSQDRTQSNGASNSAVGLIGLIGLIVVAQ